MLVNILYENIELRHIITNEYSIENFVVFNSITGNVYELLQDSTEDFTFPRNIESSYNDKCEYIIEDEFDESFVKINNCKCRYALNKISGENQQSLIGLVKK